jgi:hypothetical protein
MCALRILTTVCLVCNVDPSPRAARRMKNVDGVVVDDRDAPRKRGEYAL